MNPFSDMTQKQKDECRTILTVPESWDELETIVSYTKKHGFDVVKGFVEFNDNHWSAEDFDNALFQENYDGGWLDFFVDKVLDWDRHDNNGIDIYDYIDEPKVKEALIAGDVDDYQYLGVATGFLQGTYFRKWAS